MPPRPTKPLMELSAPHVFELTVKKSRFTAHATPITSPQKFRIFLNNNKNMAASHNCWAYSLPPSTVQFSDDGEPSGTAGRQILSAIHTTNVQRVAVLIVRHFGGIKLGTGGLGRAYFQAALQCLKEAHKYQVRDMRTINVQVGWDSVGAVIKLAEGLEKMECSFDEQGCNVTVRVESKDIDHIVEKFSNVGKGRENIVILSEEDGV